MWRRTNNRVVFGDIDIAFVVYVHSLSTIACGVVCGVMILLYRGYCIVDIGRLHIVEASGLELEGCDCHRATLPLCIRCRGVDVWCGVDIIICIICSILKIATRIL